MLCLPFAGVLIERGPLDTGRAPPALPYAGYRLLVLPRAGGWGACYHREWRGRYGLATFDLGAALAKMAASRPTSPCQGRRTTEQHPVGAHVFKYLP